MASDGGNNKTYIVIEESNKAHAREIMNVLMTYAPHARFTVTENIQEYAEERERLKTFTTPSPKTAEAIPKPQLQAQEVRETPDPSPGPPVPQMRPPIEPQLTAQQSVPFVEREIKKDNDDDSFSYQSQMSHFPYQNASNNLMAGEDGTNNDLFQPFKQPSPEYTRKRPLLVGGNRQEYKCEVCGAHIRACGFDYGKRSDHAIVHTDLFKFKCTSPGCPYKTKHRSNMGKHCFTAHGIPRSVIKCCLTEAEQALLKTKVLECFPEIRDKRKRKREEPHGSSADFRGDNNYGGEADDGEEGDYEFDDDYEVEEGSEE